MSRIYFRAAQWIIHTSTPRRDLAVCAFQVQYECAKTRIYVQARLRVNVFVRNFEGLVLGCIDADFCKQIIVGKLSPRSTQYTYASLGEKNRIENEIMKMYTNKKYSTEKAHFCTLGLQSENQD